MRETGFLFRVALEISAAGITQTDVYLDIRDKGGPQSWDKFNGKINGRIPMDENFLVLVRQSIRKLSRAKVSANFR